MDEKLTVAVIGGGAWGTALAVQANLKHSTKIYGIDLESIKEINTYHTNNRYLANIALPINLRAFTIEEFVGQEKIIIAAVPSVVLIEVINKIKNYLTKEHYIIIATKGIDYQNQKLFATTISSLTSA